MNIRRVIVTVIVTVNHGGRQINGKLQENKTNFAKISETSLLLMKQSNLTLFVDFKVLAFFRNRP